MTPHKQLFRHRPEQGEWGDCYRTAIACLLDLAPDEVPHVFDNGADGDAGNAAMHAWLATRGLALLRILYPKEIDLSDVQTTMQVLNPGLYYLLTGESRTGCDHVVVCLDGEIVHDPSLDDAGVVGPDSQGRWHLEWLVPLFMRASGGEVAA